MRKFKNNKDRQNKGGYKGMIEEAYNTKFQAPDQKRISNNSTTLQVKAFRELNNIGVIDVRVDPNAELSYGAQPYTIIGGTNKVVDANYSGKANITGNTVIMIQNDTQKSQLMNVVDVGVVQKRINYLYLPYTKLMSQTANKGYAGEVVKAIEQAVSFGFSTMLTQLPFATADYATEEGALPVPASVANSKAYGYYKALIHYQTVLQNLVTPIAKYIELRSLEREMMRMSFRTEAPILTQLFGLFKKSSFISEVNTIGTVVINEYFDTNWYKQVNTLMCVPSRKTKGMTDPLLTMISTHAIPKLTITNGTTVTYNSDNLKTGNASLFQSLTPCLELESVRVQDD